VHIEKARPPPTHRTIALKALIGTAEKREMAATLLVLGATACSLRLCWLLVTGNER
jgi:hypothetical protein